MEASRLFVYKRRNFLALDYFVSRHPTVWSCEVIQGTKAAFEYVAKIRRRIWDSGMKFNASIVSVLPVIHVSGIGQRRDRLSRGPRPKRTAVVLGPTRAPIWVDNRLGKANGTTCPTGTRWISYVNSSQPHSHQVEIIEGKVFVFKRSGLLSLRCCETSDD